MRTPETAPRHTQRQSGLAADGLSPTSSPGVESSALDDIGMGWSLRGETSGEVQPKRRRSRQWFVPALVGSAAAPGAASLYNRKQTREAERRHPLIGRFLDEDGVRLHYIERGQGEPLVLIHGNGTMIQDFIVSGLVDQLAERYRVIVIDRPGYGYSSRPGQVWTPNAHAQLFRKALAQLGIEHATVYGHSWGTLVAVAPRWSLPHLPAASCSPRVIIIRPLVRTRSCFRHQPFR